MAKTYAVYSNFHGQGAGEGQQLAYGTLAQCRHVEDALSTCSLCYPGRTSGPGHDDEDVDGGRCYDAETCYVVKCPRDLRGAPLPADVEKWNSSDISAWLGWEDEDDD